MFFGNIFLYCMLADCRKVFIMRTEDYLTNFYPTFQSILELYYSLAAVNNEENESGKTEFTSNLIKKINLSALSTLSLFLGTAYTAGMISGQGVLNILIEFWSRDISFGLIRASED